VNFSQDSIHVTVLGKAYFEVNRDSLHPYIIIQPSIVNHLPSATFMIEAVSAHFDVEAYPDSSAMRITAITGNLFIRVDSVGGKKESELQLFAGQQLEAKDGKINVIEHVDVNKVLTRAKWYGGK
jgi:ferric-dicitrate binding protein FerR (iron transport regulator)